MPVSSFMPKVPSAVVRVVLLAATAPTPGPLRSTCCQWPLIQTSKTLPNISLPRASNAGRPEAGPKLRLSAATVFCQLERMTDHANSNRVSPPVVW